MSNPYSKKLQSCDQATLNRIHRRLRSRGGVPNLGMPDPKSLADALARVRDGREILAEEIEDPMKTTTAEGPALASDTTSTGVG